MLSSLSTGKCLNTSTLSINLCTTYMWYIRAVKHTICCMLILKWIAHIVRTKHLR